MASTNDIIGSIAGAVANVVVATVMSPRNGAPANEAAAIGAQAADIARVNPTVQSIAAQVVNATNNEPWYQSRVTWGALVAGAAGVAGLFGVTIGDGERTVLVEGITAALSVVGAVTAIYGRWVARKPIGG